MFFALSEPWREYARELALRSESPLEEILDWTRTNSLSKFLPKIISSEVEGPSSVSKMSFLIFEKPIINGLEFWINQYETTRTWNVDHPNSTENFTGAVWDLATDHPLHLFFDNCEGFELNLEHLTSLPKGKVPPSGLSSLILSAKDRDKASKFFGKPVLDNQAHTVFSHSLPGSEFDLLIDVNHI